MLRIDEQYVYDYLEECDGLPEIDEAVKLIKEYRLTNFYESKNKLVASWEIDHKGIYDIIISVFTQTLTNNKLTYQTMMGILNTKIKLDNEIDRVKIFADIVGLISLTGLIDIVQEPGEYHYITTDFVIEGIPTINKHETITELPKLIKNNWYEKKSVISGHRMNHHNDYIRLSYINRMNQIPLLINQDFVDQYEEAPKEHPVTKEQKLQVKVFKENSFKAYKEIGTRVFYDTWRYDTRGRSYSGSYYMGVQGSSYKKAIIELANKEVVNVF